MKGEICNQVHPPPAEPPLPSRREGSSVGNGASVRGRLSLFRQVDRRGASSARSGAAGKSKPRLASREGERALRESGSPLRGYEVCAHWWAPLFAQVVPAQSEASALRFARKRENCRPGWRSKS